MDIPLVQVRAAAVDAARHIGRRGAFLAFLALLDWILGYGLLQPLPLGLSRESVYQPFTAIAPLPIWAGAWIGTGFMAAVSMLWHRSRSAVFAIGATLKTAWALGYFIGWSEHLPLYVRGYQTGVIFAAFGAVTMVVAGWRENGQ